MGAEGRGVEGARWSGVGVEVKSRASGGWEPGAGRRVSGATASRKAAVLW
jgi:hypothetical protein